MAKGFCFVLFAFPSFLPLFRVSILGLVARFRSAANSRARVGQVAALAQDSIRTTPMVMAQSVVHRSSALRFRTRISSWPSMRRGSSRRGFSGSAGFRRGLRDGC
jgi:hypothetical protein